MADTAEPQPIQGEEDLDFTRGMLLPSTIGIGLYAIQQTIGPVLVYYLWLKKNGYVDMDEHKWPNIAWMCYWIGNIVVYGLGALMWPFSYIGGAALDIYGFAWGWAEALEQVNMLLTFTMLMIAGIQMPGCKTVWQTLVVWMVVNGVTGMIAQSQSEAAWLYYMWGDWSKFTEEEKEWCVKDGEGKCIECTDGDEECEKEKELASLSWSVFGNF